MSAQCPLIMGILNITPDSFSGDGLLTQPDYLKQSVMQAEQMITDGADILDIGGESSRPGAALVTAREEIRRVIPVITAIKQKMPDAQIAVDTVKAKVAEQALQAGAVIVNDISALEDAAMAALLATRAAKVILMHNAAKHGAHYDAKIGGAYNAIRYTDVVDEVAKDLSARVEVAMAAGIRQENIILDPGIGFGKTPSQNLELIAHLGRIKALGFPVLMGVSRKSFIGKILDLPVDQRLEGTAACLTTCVLRGADILRVHDVKFMALVVKMAAAIRDV